MCASCGCDDVNNVRIPGNYSGLASKSKNGAVAKASVQHGEDHSPKHERTESKAERRREYGK